MQTHCPFCESNDTMLRETKRENRVCSNSACGFEWESDNPSCPRCENGYGQTRTETTTWRQCSRCEVTWTGTLPAPPPTLPMDIKPMPKPAELEERIPPSPAVMAARAEKAMQTAESGTTRFYCAENGRDYLQKFHKTASPHDLFLSHVFLTLAEGSEDLRDEHYLPVCNITQNPGMWYNAPPELHTT